MGKKCRRRPCNRLSRWDSKKCRCVRGFKKCRGRKCKTKKCRGRKCKKKKCRGRYCKKKCRRRPCNRLSRWDSKKCRCVRGFKKPKKKKKKKKKKKCRRRPCNRL